MLKRLKITLTRLFTPQRIFLLSFGGVILLGAFLLWHPFSSPEGHLNFIDALFTATSAVCVTGLTVIDLGKELTLTGQLITLLLFQIGGLGIVTFSVLLFGLMGRGISFKGREIIHSTFLPTPGGDFFLLIKRVFTYTFVIEGIGTLFLFLKFIGEMPLFRAFYFALYHAVSAFNNCGFSLFANSLMDYQGDWFLNSIVMALIIIGGIGFFVQQEVLDYWKGKRKSISLHTRLVLLTTLFLIVTGGVAFYLFEMQYLLKEKSLTQSFLISVFQSVTARTCGFNTVDIGELTNPTILVLLILMFIGASPGSTGGGIKTTSFALLILIIINQLRGSERVNIFHRTIPQETIVKVITLIFAAFVLTGAIASLLLFLGESGGVTPQASRHLFVEYVFEATSAFGTVGLSMGITHKLNDLQKLAIIFLMFAGRVGPLTLAFSLHAAKKKGLTYAEETIMVG